MKKLLFVVLTTMPIITCASAPTPVAVIAATAVRPTLAMPEDLLSYIMPGSVQQSVSCPHLNKFVWKMPATIDQAKAWACAMHQKGIAAPRMDDKLYYENAGLRFHSAAITMENVRQSQIIAQLAQENAQLKTDNEKLKTSQKEEQEGQQEAEEVAGIFNRARICIVSRAAATPKQNIQPPAADQNN